MREDLGMTDAGARTQILDAVARYCRGIDRLDAASVSRAFHPGAVLRDYGPEPMTIEAFVEHAMASLARKFSATQHRISNTLVDFEGGDEGSGAALVETYVLAFHVQPADPVAGTGELLHTFGGRYIDRFTEVGGAWRISARTLRNDWSRVEPIEERMRGDYVPSGRGGDPDPILGGDLLGDQGPR